MEDKTTTLTLRGDAAADVATMASFLEAHMGCSDLNGRPNGNSFVLNGHKVMMGMGKMYAYFRVCSVS